MIFTLTIVIIISLIYIRWIIFALMYLPLSAWIARRPVGEVCLPPVGETDSTTPATQPRVPVARRLKDFISVFFQSYYRYSVIQVGKIPSHHVRKFLYRNLYKVRMERDVVLYYGTEIRGSWNLSIGKGSIVGDNALLDARRVGITIGSNVNIGSNVSMYTGQHNYNDPYFRPTADNVGPISIGDRAWIGPNVTILHGVTIGEGAIIAAGAVVTRNIPPYTLAGGIPAKKIGDRSHDLRYEFSENERLMFY